MPPLFSSGAASSTLSSTAEREKQKKQRNCLTCPLLCRYTSQAKTKKGNRQCEFLLRETELWWCSSPALLRRYPATALLRLWQLVLLTQFHDVLPGSSIGAVYRDAEAHLAQVLSEGRALLDQALLLLQEEAPTAKRVRSASAADPRKGRRVYNSLGWPRAHFFADGSHVQVPPFSFAYPDAPAAAAVAVPSLASPDPSGAGWVLENEELRAHISSSGTVTSLLHKHSMREALSAPGNSFVIYDDVNL